MLKGLIIEKGEKYYIVLTPTGAYKKIKGLTTKNIGQEIYINNIFSMTKIVSLAAALLVIIMLIEVILIMPGQNQVYAYVTLDINPSVEFAVDRNYAVLKAYPFNSEAAQILSDIKYLYVDINKVLADFTLAAIDNEYISENQENYVEISVYPTKLDESIEPKLNEITRTQKEIIESSGKKAEINASVINDDKTIEKAKDLKMPPGQIKENKNGLSDDAVDNIVITIDIADNGDWNYDISFNDTDRESKNKEDTIDIEDNKDIKETEENEDDDEKNEEDTVAMLPLNKVIMAGNIAKEVDRAAVKLYISGQLNVRQILAVHSLAKQTGKSFEEVLEVFLSNEKGIGATAKALGLTQKTALKEINKTFKDVKKKIQAEFKEEKAISHPSKTDKDKNKMNKDLKDEPKVVQVNNKVDKAKHEVKGRTEDKKDKSNNQKNNKDKNNKKENKKPNNGKSNNGNSKNKGKSK